VAIAAGVAGAAGAAVAAGASVGSCADASGERIALATSAAMVNRGVNETFMGGSLGEAFESAARRRANRFGLHGAKRAHEEGGEHGGRRERGAHGDRSHRFRER